MYLRESIEFSQHEKIRNGKKIIANTKHVVYHFKCDNCHSEFARRKNGQINKDSAHFCPQCDSPLLRHGEKTKADHVKAELLGEKFDRGYKEIYVGKNYPYRPGHHWVREHIAVMERNIQKKIPSGMVVHHIDGVKRNNDISNLLLCTIAEHNNCHAKSESIVFELYRRGIVGFDKDTMTYFLKE